MQFDRLISRAAIVAAIVTGSAGAGLLSGAIRNTSTQHDYYLTTQSNWTDAEALAISLGGHLVTVNDAAENQWILDTFGTFDGRNRQLWIGLNDLQSAGNFVWTSGEAVSFTNWSVGEPNFIGSERHVFIYGPGTPKPAGLWNNEYNRTTFESWGLSGGFHGVIEVVPAPAAALLLPLASGLRRRRSPVR